MVQKFDFNNSRLQLNDYKSLAEAKESFHEMGLDPDLLNSLPVAFLGNGSRWITAKRFPPYNQDATEIRVAMLEGFIDSGFPLRDLDVEIVREIADYERSLEENRGEPVPEIEVVWKAIYQYRERMKDRSMRAPIYTKIYTLCKKDHPDAFPVYQITPEEGYRIDEYMREAQWHEVHHKYVGGMDMLIFTEVQHPVKYPYAVVDWVEVLPDPETLSNAERWLLDQVEPPQFVEATLVATPKMKMY